ncbi:hypothetical protein F5972_25265 [Microbispora cellulosiformans]|uniref:Effector-associated domain-containing protein n=1 Tax=Microbispora cellulosiformans TaxID=2614688 RepID=A0A5J5JX38_9ACTN|nr:effector-associated domain EAD1-containing protein [Microbispora cellulosiformans]KAA9376027.1 hypothetical protein F5972_25265 [Microbispora cellulosiformans]
MTSGPSPYDFVPDWSDRRLHDLRDALLEAYPERNEVRNLVDMVAGLPWTALITDGINTRDIWKEVIDQAADHGCFRALLDVVLADTGKFGHRRAIQEAAGELFNRRAPMPVPPGGATPAEWDPFHLGVNRPATAPGVLSGASLPPLTPYIVRPHDRLLRKVLSQSASTIVVLVGSPATGRTRTALEAVRSCLPDWSLVRPIDIPDLMEMLKAGWVVPRTVLWLDRVPLFLNHNETVARMLRQLLGEPVTGPVVVIGTASLVEYEEMTEGCPETSHHVRELLRNAKLDVPETVSLPDHGAWRDPTHGDPRLILAEKAAGSSGKIVQALTGGAALLQRYDSPMSPQGTYAHTIARAAMDLERLGIHHLIPHDLLAAVAERHAKDASYPDGWFEDGLAEALRPVHGVSSLERSPTPGKGYILHNALTQHGRSRLRGTVVLPGVWEILLNHAVPAEDAFRVAREAHRRGLYRYAVRLAVPLSDAGHEAASIALSRWLTRAGLVEEAGVRLAACAGTGSAEALRRYAEWLDRQDREDEADAVWKRAVAAGDGIARTRLAARLERTRDLGSLRALWLEGAMNGDPEAALRLVELLDQAGDIEKWLRVAARRGDPAALGHLVVFLDAAARHAEADTLLRDSAHPEAHAQLVDRLVKAGRIREAFELTRGTGVMRTPLADALKAEGMVEELEEYLTSCAALGNTVALLRLVALLDAAGRADQATEWLQRAVAFGDGRALTRLVDRLDRTTSREETDDLLRDLAEAGDVAAMKRLQFRSSGPEVVEHWLGAAAVAGDAASLRELVQRLIERRRKADARTWLERCVKAGNAEALRRLVDLAESPSDAERWLRHAVETGMPGAIDNLARLLRKSGRTEEADQLHRYGIEPGGVTSRPWMVTGAYTDAEPR